MKYIRKNKNIATLKGTQDIPRLTIHKSNNHIYAQLINDLTGYTICSSNTKQLDSSKKKVRNKNFALICSNNLLNLMKEHNISKFIYTTKKYKFSGIIKVFIDNLNFALKIK